MTLKELQNEIAGVVSEGVDLATKINNAIRTIAGGVRMPNGLFTPPLPDLMDSGTIVTTSSAYTSMPSNYQRELFMVVRETTGFQILPPRGGTYYSFALFMNQVVKKDLSLTGYPHIAAIKGTSLYYQGAPTGENLTVWYYRKPTDMSAPTDNVDGIDDRFVVRVVKDYVAAQIEKDLGDYESSRFHMNEFYNEMVDMADFIGTDEIPEFYGVGDSMDEGVCD